MTNAKPPRLTAFLILLILSTVFCPERGYGLDLKCSALGRLVTGFFSKTPRSEQTEYHRFSDNGTGWGKQTVIPGDVSDFINSKSQWTARNKWNYIQENTVEERFDNDQKVSYRRHKNASEKKAENFRKALAVYDNHLSTLADKVSIVHGAYDNFRGITDPRYNELQDRFRKASNAGDIQAAAAVSYDLFVIRSEYVLQQAGSSNYRLSEGEKDWLRAIRPQVKRLMDSYATPPAT